MKPRPSACTFPLLLLGTIGLCACASPRDELVPYMSSEGVANAAYTANYNGNASASGKLRVQPAVQTEAAKEAETPASDAAEASER